MQMKECSWESHEVQKKSYMFLLPDPKYRPVCPNLQDPQPGSSWKKAAEGL